MKLHATHMDVDIDIYIGNIIENSEEQERTEEEYCARSHDLIEKHAEYSQNALYRI